MNIENTVHQLQKIVPSKKLTYRITQMASDLPIRSPGFDFPLLTFRVALAGIVLFLVSGIGTSVLLAAKGSSQGSVLYPMKQTLEKHHVPFFVPTLSPAMILPKTLPSPTEPQPTDTEKGKSASDSGTSIHHSVTHGGDDEQEKEGPREKDDK